MNIDKIQNCLEQLKIHKNKSIKTIREILLEIENNGGFVALGYQNATEFYRVELAEYYGQNSLSGHSSAISIELLLGIEVGTYPHHLLPNYGLKMINTAAHNRSKSKQQGVSCSLKTAQIIKERWVKICEECRTSTPTRQMLLNYLPKTRDKKTYYTEKIKTITETKKDLQAQIELLTKRLEILQKRLQDNKPKVISEVPEITRMAMSELREANEKLKDKNAILTKENRQLKQENEQLKRQLLVSA